MTVIESKITELEQVPGILYTNAFSTILSYLDRPSILQFSLANKHLRRLIKAKLFSKIVLIPSSISAKSDFYKSRINISNEDKNFLKYLIAKYYKYFEELTISHFDNRNLVIHSLGLNYLRSLKLYCCTLNQGCLFNIICSFSVLENLIIQDVHPTTYYDDAVICGRYLPYNLANLQIYKSRTLYSSGFRIEGLFNTHSRLKYLRVDYRKLLEGLLNLYPSLNHLVIRLGKSSSMLKSVFPNLINLRTLDLLYTKLNYGDIASILKLRNLEDFKFNCRLELFDSNMKPILCTSLKQLSIKSSISPEWTEFFLNSCPNIENLKLLYKKSLVFTKPELFNRLKYLSIINHSSRKLDLQTLLQSPNLKKLEIFVMRPIDEYKPEFFQSSILNSNWKIKKFNNCIKIYK